MANGFPDRLNDVSGEGTERAGNGRLRLKLRDARIIAYTCGKKHMYRVRGRQGSG
jgi:translation initiation factor IF-1